MGDSAAIGDRASGRGDSTGSVFVSPRLWWRIALLVVAVSAFLTGNYTAVWFTSQSMLMVVVYYVVTVHLMIRSGRRMQPAPRFRGAITTYALTTCLVSHFVNNAGQSPLPGLSVSDPYLVVDNWSVFLMHYIVPLMVLIDWLVFGPHALRWRDLFLWLIFPFGYAAVIVVRGMLFPAIDDRYPYGFFDPTISGWGGVAVGILQVLAMIIVIGVAVVGLGKLSDLIGSRRRTPSQ